RREVGIPPEHAEGNGAQADERADGKVDAAGEDDGGEGEGEEAELDVLHGDREEVAEGDEVFAEHAEDGDFEEENDGEDDLLGGDVEVFARRRQRGGGGGGGCGFGGQGAHAAPPAGAASSVAACVRVRKRISEPTARRIIAPWAAFSQSGG